MIGYIEQFFKLLLLMLVSVVAVVISLVYLPVKIVYGALSCTLDYIQNLVEDL